MQNLPDIHANDRDIPPGKVLIRQCGLVPADAPLARPIVLDEASGKFGRTYRLEAIPAGWEIAGSVMRWTNGVFAAVMIDRDGTHHGCRFEDFDSAQGLFKNWEAS